MKRSAVLLAAIAAVAVAGDALGYEVPEWNEAQKEFFSMSPAERRTRFTNEGWRKSIRFSRTHGKWREAREGERSRFVHLSGIPNMRDLGGLSAADGKRIKRGLIYRSAGLNLNAPYRMVTNENGKAEREYYGRGGERLGKGAREYAVDTLGIRTDLDLRGEGECKGMTGSPLGPKVKWVRTSFRGYADLFSPEGKASFKEAFSVLLDESRYPLVFHCIAGADRTGTLAYIVEALCGVSDADLMFDWELTALANPNVHFAHKDRYDKLVAGFAKYPGATARERVEAFVKEQGFSDADIAKLRAFLLEDAK